MGFRCFSRGVEQVVWLLLFLFGKPQKTYNFQDFIKELDVFPALFFCDPLV